MYSTNNDPNLSQGKQIEANKDKYNISSSISQLKDELSHYKNLSTTTTSVSDYNELYKSNQELYNLAKGINVELYDIINSENYVSEIILNQQEELYSNVMSLLNKNDALINETENKKDIRSSIHAIYQDSETSMTSNKIFFFIWLISLLFVCGITFSTVYGNEASIVAYGIAGIFILITGYKYFKWAFDKLYY